MTRDKDVDPRKHDKEIAQIEKRLEKVERKVYVLDATLKLIVKPEAK